MKLRAGALAGAVVWFLLAPPTAGAQGDPTVEAIERVDDDNQLTPAEIEDVTVRVLASIAKGSFRRARRAIAIGPSVGGSYVAYPNFDESSGSVSFGVSLYTFKVPIMPDTALVKDMIKTRIKAKIKEIIKRAFQGRPVTTEAEKQQLIQEIVEEIRDELLGFGNFRSKTFERPRFALTLEGDYNLEAEFFATRLRAGMGFSRLLISATATSYFADNTLIILGGEMALLVTPTKGPRSPVFDVFFRAEFPVNKQTDAYSVGGGIRLLIDII